MTGRGGEGIKEKENGETIGGDYSKEAVVLNISLRGSDYSREAINRRTTIIRGNVVYKELPPPPPPGGRPGAIDFTFFPLPSMECSREFYASLLPLLLSTLLHDKFGFFGLENEALKLHPTVYHVSFFQLFVSRIYCVTCCLYSNSCLANITQRVCFS